MSVRLADRSSLQPALAPRPRGRVVSQRRLRVMQIAPTLGLGGLERVIITLCNALDPERIEPSVLCLRGQGELAGELISRGIPVLEIEHTPGEADYLAFRKVARVLREQAIDVIHTHNTQAFLDGALGGLLAGTRTIVHTDHARLFPDKLRYMVAEHIMSHFVHRVVGVSEHTTSNLRRYERIPPRKLTTIPNGVDGDRYDVRVDVRAKRRELGLGSSGPVIGIAARFMEQKGIIYMLQALTTLRRSFPDISLVLAGEGPLEAELRTAARELGVDEHVHFVGMRQDMPELLKVFDMVALPSIWEGLPMILLEAFASGCPVVASDVGGVPAAITHNESGLLIPPREPDRLADAIATVLSDAAVRARLIAGGRKTFEERYSARAMARQYEALYFRGTA